MNFTNYPLVSVIIPAYNCASYINSTLDSVYEQDYPSDKIEIIVINDGSTDDTLNVLRLQRHSRIILIDSLNQGPSAARELGRIKARGEYLQYLDSDDLLTPNKLKLQVESLIDSGKDIAYGDWNRFIEKDGEKTVIEWLSPSLSGNPEIQTFTNFWCPLAALLYSKHIVDKIGPWNSKYPVIQDARYLQDAARLGATFVKVAGVMAYYRQHNSNSVSTRSRNKFIFDVYQNALEYIGFWENRLDADRLKALHEVLGGCAKYFIEHDPKLFEECVSIMNSIDPKGRYIPHKPFPLKVLSQFIGYHYAEKLAWNYRLLKMKFKKKTILE